MTAPIGKPTPTQSSATWDQWSFADGPSTDTSSGPPELGGEGTDDLFDQRYRFLREIAVGTSSVIYEAEHTITGRRVALKLLRGRSRDDPVFQARMVHEARMLEAGRQMGVVDLLDAASVPRYGPYLALELLRGRNLDGILTARQILPLRDATQVALHICRTVARLHGRGVVHGDIRPRNIFVARDEVAREGIKLLDFGLAWTRALDRGPAPTTQQQRPRERVGGSADYLPPEGRPSPERDPYRADLYALGVTVYECFHGSLPPGADRAAPAVNNRLLADAPQPLRSSISDPLASVLLRAVARDPKDRYPTADAFAAALTTTAEGSFVSTDLLGLPPRPGSQQDTSRSAEVTPDPPVAPARRRFPRAPYCTPVRIVLASGETLDGRCEDISQGGLLVLTPHPCNNEEQVEVRFALPMTGKLARLKAISRWVRTARHSGAAGLEFVDPPVEVGEAIAAFVQAMGGA